MDDKPRYKYAIVRVKETAVVDFFGLIAGQGYSDVSFVSNLSQAISRPDPNDDDIKDSKHDDRVRNCDQIADSEDRCSMSVTPQSPSDDVIGTSSSSHLTNHIAMMCNDPKPSRNGDSEVADIAAAASSDLISNLFATHTIPLTAKEWSCEQMDGSPGPVRTPQFNKMMCNQLLQSSQSSPQFQTRMKGWQREYIKDVINNGHYPTEEELRDIEQKCDLSRKQVLRFIAKRLVNPNRKPRADWRMDRANESVSPTVSPTGANVSPIMKSVKSESP